MRKMLDKCYMIGTGIRALSQENLILLHANNRYRPECVSVQSDQCLLNCFLKSIIAKLLHE